MKDVQDWLSPADYWENYLVAHESRHKGTLEWFVQDTTFNEWKTSNSGSILWVHGKRPLLPSLYGLAETDRFHSHSGRWKGGSLVR